MGACDSGLQWPNEGFSSPSHVRTSRQGSQCEALQSQRNNGPLLHFHYTECGAHGAQPENGAKVSTVMQRLQATAVISTEIRERA